MKCNCKQHEACQVIWQSKWQHFCVVTIICHTPNLLMSRVALLMLVACSFQAHNKWPAFLLILLNLCVSFTLMVNHQFPKLSSKQEMHTNLQYLDIFIQCLFFKSFLAMCLPQKFDECFFFFCDFFFICNCKLRKYLWKYMLTPIQYSNLISILTIQPNVWTCM